jgi:large subunit ribosomal protein L37Ae
LGHCPIQGYLKLFIGNFLIGEQMKTTKKVKTTGRFGSRYGVGIRKRVSKLEERKKLATLCPFCGFNKIKRIAAGLFVCTKCGAKFTGGAYEPETLIGKTIRKMVAQKSFVADATELIKATEEKSSYSDIEEEITRSMSEDNKGENKKEHKPGKEYKDEKENKHNKENKKEGKEKVLKEKNKKKEIKKKNSAKKEKKEDGE